MWLCFVLLLRTWLLWILKLNMSLPVLLFLGISLSSEQWSTFKKSVPAIEEAIKKMEGRIRWVFNVTIWAMYVITWKFMTSEWYLITQVSKCGGVEISEYICAECLFLFLFSWCVDCLLTANYMIFFVVVYKFLYSSEYLLLTFLAEKKTCC